MRARAAWAAILLGSLVAGLVLLRDHGLCLWTGVHVHEIRVPLISEHVFVVDATAQTYAASIGENGVYFALIKWTKGVFLGVKMVGEIGAPSIWLSAEDCGGWCRKCWDLTAWRYFYSCCHYDLVRRCLPNIANIEAGPCDPSGLKTLKGIGFDNEIGPQLPLGGDLGTLNQLSSLVHQSLSYEDQPYSYKRKKSLTKLKGEERYFWSFMASVACLWLGWLIWCRGNAAGMCLVLYAICGLVGRFDLFSIFQMLR